MFRVLPIHRKLQLQVHTVKGHVKWLFHPPGHGYQWRIQDFPKGVCQLQKLLLYFKFLPKTAWKWKNLDPRGVHIPGAPPWIHQWLFKYKLPNKSSHKALWCLCYYCWLSQIVLVEVDAYVSLRLRMQNVVPTQPCVGKLGISLVLLNFLHCNFRLWFKTS